MTNCFKLCYRPLTAPNLDEGLKPPEIAFSENMQPALNIPWWVRQKFWEPADVG